MLSRQQAMALPFSTKFVSSQIEGIYHDEKTETLFIKFKSHAIFSYYKFTKKEYQMMMSDELSIGKYFAKYIKGNSKYNYNKH